MKKNWGILLLIFGILVLGNSELFAQCAMCRASLENNVSNGEVGIAARLNLGILFLFALPYLLVMTIGILWYKKSKKTSFKNIMAEERRKRLARLKS